MTDPAPFVTLMIRPALDADGDAFGRLTARCWADYPGCYYDRRGELADLDRIASLYEERDGQAWAAISQNRLVGTVAVAPAGQIGDAWEIAKLYVAPDIRRQNVATLLLDTAEAFVAERGGRRVVLWTDTRFAGAHRFYEQRGYVQDGRTRALHDLSQSVESFYAKRLVGGPAS